MYNCISEGATSSSAVITVPLLSK